MLLLLTLTEYTPDKIKLTWLKELSLKMILYYYFDQEGFKFMKHYFYWIVLTELTRTAHLFYDAY